MSGKGNHQYDGGSGSRGFTDRERKEIFNRDDYTCVSCGESSVYLNAHHIKPAAEFPELQHNIDNGITLCVDCHANEHKDDEDISVYNLIKSQSK